MLLLGGMMLEFFFNDTAPTEIYTYGPTLSLHDALPISGPRWTTAVMRLRSSRAGTCRMYVSRLSGLQRRVKSVGQPRQLACRAISCRLCGFLCPSSSD